MNFKDHFNGVIYLITKKKGIWILLWRMQRFENNLNNEWIYLIFEKLVFR